MTNKIDKYEDFIEALGNVCYGEKGICEALNSNTLISLTPLSTGNYKMSVQPHYAIGMGYEDENAIDAIDNFRREFLKA